VVAGVAASTGVAAAVGVGGLVVVGSGAVVVGAGTVVVGAGNVVETGVGVTAAGWAWVVVELRFLAVFTEGVAEVCPPPIRTTDAMPRVSTTTTMANSRLRALRLWRKVAR
jgi:hypothetical protein